MPLIQRHGKITNVSSFDFIDDWLRYRLDRIKQMNKLSFSIKDKAPLEDIITSELLLVEQKSQILHELRLSKFHSGDLPNQGRYHNYPRQHQ